MRDVCDIAPKSPLECPSPELLALSVTDWQLRRVCVPFLFGKIRIRHDKDAKNLEEHLAICAKFTKTLFLGSSDDLTEEGELIVSRILPELERLLDVNLGDCLKRADLFKTILAHPSITSVLVDGIPAVSAGNHDLSKVILNRSGSISFSPFSPTFKQYFDQGMRLKCLSLGFNSLDSRLQTLNFPGLEAIEIFMSSVPISFSWLTQFSSTHPTLNELWLSDMDSNFSISVYGVPPFLSSLVKVIQRLGFPNPFVITDVGLRRPKSIGPSSQEWHVTELFMRTSRSLTRTLSLLSSSFPRLEIISIDLESDQGMYNIGDLCSAFARFSSLRVVYLENILRRLPFGTEIKDMMRVDATHTYNELRVRAERELLAFASRLAKQVRTLDSLYIEDAGYEHDDGGECVPLWCFRGWLHVLDSDRHTYYVVGRKRVLNRILPAVLRLWRPILFNLFPPETHISHDEDAKKLDKHLALCAKLTKTLVLGSSSDLTEVGEQIISQILPQLKQLLDVELGGCLNRIDMLTTILAHPTVTSVLIDELPHVSMCNHDLSKVILICNYSTSPFSPTLAEYFDRGMKLKCLSLYPVFIDNQLQTLNLAGLETIEIFMLTGPVPISWLSRFASTHPTLNELWFFEIYQDLFTDNAPPFLSSLVDNVRQGLHDTSTLLNIGLRRPIGRSSQEWHVIGLTLRTGHSLIEKLLLSASSFPKLEILTLDFESQQGMYDIEDLYSVLARFSSLRVMYLKHLLRRLPSGSEIEDLMRPSQHTTHTLHELQVCMEREMWALISCVAKHVRSLDSVYIEDAGWTYEDGDCIQLWGFEGWLHKCLRSYDPERESQSEALGNAIREELPTQTAQCVSKSDQLKKNPQLTGDSFEKTRSLASGDLFLRPSGITLSSPLMCLYLPNELLHGIIEALFIGSDDFTQVGEQIISQVLPQLEQLLDVELGRCSKRTDLLKAVLAHPSVTSVLVDEIPDESMCNHDLSKVILNRFSFPSPADEKYFDCSMRLKHLSLDMDSDSIDSQLETVNFPGVETIEMYDSTSFSWLSRFSLNHPTLNELWLLEIEEDLFIHDAALFLALVQEYQPPQDLHDPFNTIWEVGLCRAKPLGKSSQEWHVVELTLEIDGSLFEQLSLLAFSFPKLEILTLDLSYSISDVEVYDISDLSSVLAGFSSLRV
ncbi:hypothetical protein EV360DRAFT_74240, partial [Lentinula raphanica]